MPNCTQTIPKFQKRHIKIKPGSATNDIMISKKYQKFPKKTVVLPILEYSYSTNRVIQTAIIVPVTSKNWLVWEWDLFSFIWFASVGLLWSLCMTDSCVYILGQSRGRGGLAREARQGAASREKAKVANLIIYTNSNTLKQRQRQMQDIKQRQWPPKVANSRYSFQEPLTPQSIVWSWNKKSPCSNAIDRNKSNWE